MTDIDPEVLEARRQAQAEQWRRLAYFLREQQEHPERVTVSMHTNADGALVVRVRGRGALP